MALRKLVSLPTPPDEASGPIAGQLLAMPQLAPLRMFWDNFRDLQPWWPVLVPLLVWVGVRAYRRERAAIQGGER